MTITATAANTGSNYVDIETFLANAIALAGGTAIKATFRSAGDNVDLIFTGTGFTPGSPFGSGTITGLQIKTLVPSAVTLTLTGFNIAGAAMDAAIAAAQSADFTLLDALLFGSENYSFTGGNGADLFKGSTLDDVLKGGGGADELDGGKGDDLLVGGTGGDKLSGGDGSDTASYAGLAAAVTINLEAGTASGGDAAGDTFDKIENLIGGNVADTLTGSTVENVIEGGKGADVLDGGASADTIGYASSTAAVTVALGAAGIETTGAGGDAAGDKLVNFESITGSKFNDKLTGNEQDNVIDGGTGNDLIEGGVGGDEMHGGDGIDTLSYASSSKGVFLLLGGKGEIFSPSGGDAAGDSGDGFEVLLGSNFFDALFMGINGGVLNGGGGSDFLNPGGGVQTVIGGDGTDLVGYQNSLAAVTVTLLAGGALTIGKGGDAEGDKISQVEGVFGGDFNDILTGSKDSGDNLNGDDGNDILSGGAGNDFLSGSNGDDLLIGGAGGDSMQGGDNIDTVSYAGATVGVTVALDIGGSGTSGTGGDGEGDTVFDVENMLGGNAGDKLTGNDLDNVIEGGLGDDALDGNTQGAAGDTASYAAASKSVTASLLLQGTAQATGAAGNDTLTNFENLLGGKFNDVLSGDGLDNRLDGGLGNDLLEGGAGADELDGGDGVDSLSYATSDVAVNVQLDADGGIQSAIGGHAVGDTGSGIENLIGSEFNDLLRGADAVSVLKGGNGNDLLIGDTASGIGGNDILDGGEGNDLIFGSVGADTLLGGAGTGDQVSYIASADAVTVTLGANGAQTIGAGSEAKGDKISGFEDIVGSFFSDILTGNNLDNVLSGGDGNDKLAGGTGNDVIFGEDDDDTMVGGAGADNLGGGDGNDTVAYAGAAVAVTVTLGAGGGATLNTGGDAEGDQVFDVENIVGGNGADKLTGNDFDNVIEGGKGADVLDGGTESAGGDTLNYASSAVAVTVALGAGGAETIGAGGDAAGDSIKNFENIIGSKFNDRLTGNDLVNLIQGGAGNDLLEGGADGDQLHGGDGFDTLSYAGSLAGVTVFLNALGGIFGAAGGDAESDTGSGFESIVGSGLGDVLIAFNPVSIFGGDGNDSIGGDVGKDKLDGGDGDDFLTGGLGADTLIGGLGAKDQANYSISTAAVTVTLGANGALTTATGGDAAGDKLTAIENIGGTDHADVLTGNNLDNLLLGRGENDKLSGGAGNDQLDGDQGDDVLDGGVGNDMLSGDDSNDTLIGGAGADDIDGGGDADTLSYAASSAGVNLTLADAGSALGAGGDAEGDQVTKVENIIGSAFADSLRGNSSTNVIEGGKGADELDGGGSTDWVSYEKSSAAVTITLGVLGAQTTGAGGDAAGDKIQFFESIIGSKFNDVLVGNDFANNFGAGEGNDKLSGGGLGDAIAGGGGNDTVEGGSGGDFLVGGAGIDTLSYAGSAGAVLVTLGLGGAITSASGGDAAGDTGGEFENIVGSAVDDFLQGNDAINSLDGGDGNDFLVGGGGADVLIGGAGSLDQALYQSSGAAVTLTLGANGAQAIAHGGDAEGDKVSQIEAVAGSAFNDILTGNNLDDVLSGVGGDDKLTGAAGNDGLLGGDGNDLLIGGTGADTINGGNNVDTVSYLGAAVAVTVALGLNGTLSVGSGGDADGDKISNVEIIIGGSGKDILTGNNVDNTIEGGKSADTLDGGSGGFDILSYKGSTAAVTIALDAVGGGTGTGGDAAGDTFANFDGITGGSGADKLSGNAAVNVLTGGLGADTLTGGGAVDSFRYNSLAEKGDHITDFTPGGDKIIIDHNGFANTIAGSTTFVANSLPAPDPGSTDAWFLYDTDDGKLYFDSDGTGAQVKVFLLTLDGAPVISGADILVV